MVSPELFCHLLAQHGLSNYYGVPDSLLKNLCAYIDSTFESNAHVITANEGNAIGMATGHYLGAGQPAVVYMQNSGLGNTINPLTSLADPEVYGIPMLMVIGWRGEPNVKDEPQHVKQGQITQQQLDVLGVPYITIDSGSILEDALPPLLETMKTNTCPVAILVRKDTFSATDSASSKSVENRCEMSREEALSLLLGNMSGAELIISTTGKTSRELFEIRQTNNQDNTDFLTVGGMGHTLSIAMGVARVKPNRQVIALDGDGSMLMHMGALAIAGASNLDNLIHVVLNNQCHDSVGGQPTVAGGIDIESIALGCKYDAYYCCDDSDSLTEAWSKIIAAMPQCKGPILFEVKIKQGARSDLGRPTSTPIENKLAFMQHSHGE
ncbi:phosphonopyruvate decarboxylase [Alteromonas lipotrueae]|uniref:phosphonopyruvate decarboxylase n=1 Tax=Alteromonas lipotrueae TaxID=2803814 RepID=UPI001C463160|nr:phosphonopyruvate decarboxylase [Alteromonas lipotrueae]